MYTVYVVPLSVAKCLSIISLSLMMGLISSLTPFTPSMWYLFNTSLSDPSSALLSKTRMSVNSKAYTSGKEDEKGHTCEFIHSNYVLLLCVIHVYVHVYRYTSTCTCIQCMYIHVHVHIHSVRTVSEYVLQLTYCLPVCYFPAQDPLMEQSPGLGGQAKVLILLCYGVSSLVKMAGVQPGLILFEQSLVLRLLHLSVDILANVLDTH